MVSMFCASTKNFPLERNVPARDISVCPEVTHAANLEKKAGRAARRLRQAKRVLEDERTNPLISVNRAREPMTSLP